MRGGRREAVFGEHLLEGHGPDAEARLRKQMPACSSQKELLFKIHGYSRVMNSSVFMRPRANAVQAAAS